jgi:RNA-directed DNA polymerase
VKERVARGEVIVMRYADDFVLGFRHEADAVRFRAALQQRLKRFGLEVHLRQDAADPVRQSCCIESA